MLTTIDPFPSRYLAVIDYFATHDQNAWRQRVYLPLGFLLTGRLLESA